MSYNFVDNFWLNDARIINQYWNELPELDFTGVAGYEVLVKRLKDGKKMTQDFEDFVRARAKLEETYAKELMKLVKNSHGETEIGSLRSSWDSLKAETEASSREHLGVSQRLTSDLEKGVKDFKERQRDTRKKSEETVKKSQGFKKSAYQSENKAKQDYHSKCRAADRAEDLAGKPGNLPKKVDELKLKARKARQASEMADLNYQDSVKNLDEGQLLWEREMEVACCVFQDLEEERILFLRQMMWKYCNVYSSLAVKNDEAHENVRCTLEQCDADSDLMLFVQQKRTGSDRPVPIEYENFYGQNPPQSIRPNANRGGQSMMSSHQSTSSVHNQPAQMQAHNQPPQMQARILPRPPGAGSEPPISAHARPPADVPGLVPMAMDDGVYTIVPQSMQQQQQQQHNGGMASARGGGGGGTGQCRSNFPYEAQGPEELTFSEGEVITIVMKEDSNWWLGELRGKQGMFPCNYVTEF